jgi:hypothetical protein
MATDDLFQALQMFQNGVKEYAFSQSLAEANEQVRQIKGSALKEHEQRAALQQLSDSLVMRMASIGAPATTLQAVAGAVGPTPFLSPEQLINQGVQSGNQGMVDQGTTILNQINKPKEEAEKRRFNQQQKMQQDLFKQQDERDAEKAKLAIQLETMRANKQKQNQADVDFQTNVDSALKNAKQLNDTFKTFGNFEFSDPKASAVLNQAAYDLAIAYAKIVDPATAAREGEVAAAQKYMIPMGMSTRNSVTMASINEYMKKIQQRVKAREQAKKSGKVDIYDMHFGVQPDSNQMPTATGSDDISKFLE